MMAVSAELKAKILERWPAYAWLTEVEEIANLLTQAVEQDWAPDLFGAKLKATAWWNQRTESARAWADFEATAGTETVRQRVNATKVQASMLAAQLGGQITDAQAGDLAWRYSREGWNETQFRQAIAATVKPGGTPQINVQALASKWMVSLSQGQIDDFTRRLFTGEIDQNGLMALMQGAAASQFPQLADVISKGIAPADFFAPYKNMIAEMTDTNEAAIDLRSDPVWSRVISTADEKTGQIRPMSLNEAQKFIRGTDQFGNSRRGQMEAAQFVTDFAQQLGLKR